MLHIPRDMPEVQRRGPAIEVRSFHEGYFGVDPLAKRDVDVELQRRQVGCDTPCSFLNAIISCSDDLTCGCNVITGAGSSAISACATCISSTNTTLANELLTLAQECLTLGTALSTIATTNGPSITGTPTITGPSNATITSAPTGIAACANQCNLILNGATLCGNNDTCICPTVMAGGSQCSSCLATVALNQTAAGIIGQVITSCSEILAPTKTSSSSSSHSGSSTSSQQPNVVFSTVTATSASGAHQRFTVGFLDASGIYFITAVAVVAGLLSIFG
jgi:hypothetical protein